MRKKIDPTLAAMIMGIPVFGLLCQLALVWFVRDKIGYSMGLWIGIILAIAYTYHLWWTIDRNLTFNAADVKSATAYSVKNSAIRYGGVMIALGLVWYLGGDTMMLSCALGIIGVKAGAYMQPLMNRIIFKNKDKEVDL